MYSIAEVIAHRAVHDSEPDTDPHSSFWRGVSALHFAGDFHGKPVAGHATQLLLQWTPENFYLLFLCPYEKLHLKPHPDLKKETYELWNWDVAEVFIGSDFEQIHRYKEFEVSPQGEWVDLDIDLEAPAPQMGWTWDSGCAVAGRIDAAAKVWLGFMRIPWRALDAAPVRAGNRFRVNFFRCQGAGPERKYIAWQAPQRPSFHTPEVFGTLCIAE